MKTLSTLLLALFLFTSTGIAQNRGQRPEDGRPNRGERAERMDPMQRMIRFLELSDKQVEQIKALQIPHEKQMTQFRNQLGEKRARMKTLMSADDPNQKEIEKLIDSSSAIENNMKKEKANHMIAVKKLLNDEQKVKFDKLAERRKNQRNKRRPQRGWK